MCCPFFCQEPCWPVEETKGYSETGTLLVYVVRGKYLSLATEEAASTSEKVSETLHPCGHMFSKLSALTDNEASQRQG